MQKNFEKKGKVSIRLRYFERSFFNYDLKKWKIRMTLLSPWINRSILILCYMSS